MPTSLAAPATGRAARRGAGTAEIAVANWLRYVDDPADAPIASSPARAQAMSWE